MTISHKPGAKLPYVIAQSAKVVRSRFALLCASVTVTVILITIGIFLAREIGVMNQLATAVEKIQKKPGLFNSVSASSPGTLERTMTQFVDCMAKESDYFKAQMCWSNFKRESMLDMLDRLDRMDFEQVKRFQQSSEYEYFQLLIPTHECDTLKFSRFGTNAWAEKPGELHPDGPKWMCPEYFETGAEQCVVFSVGSRGDFAFETSIHDFVGDRCKIFTFDCTGSWTNPVTTFNSWCIGPKNEMIAGRTYKTLDTMMADVGVNKIHLFKLDVDGFEWPILDMMEKAPRSALPKQILIELHLAPWPYSPDIDVSKNETWIKHSVATYRQLDRLGYRIAWRELNFYGRVAAEFVLILDP
ncbi:hypothetical protein HDU76_000743 [Blyttiomyces sp. JEL0837]|nr:hypothetical protein HDU76_000743 [Blyttiomyces sp. JEL0837]